MAKGRPSAADLRLRAELLARAARFARCAKRLRRSPDPDAIHDARVAARRLREALGLLDAPTGTLRRLDQCARRTMHSLRRARGTDVALGWFSALRPRGAAERAALADLLGRLRRRRGEHRAGVRAAARAHPRESSVATAPLTAPAGRSGALAAARRQVARRFAEAAARRRRIRGATDLDGLHAFRIAVKRLRYAAEMLDAAEGRDSSRRVERLRRLQAALGSLNDLRDFRDRLRKRAGKLAGSPECARLRAGYAALERRVEEGLRRARALAMPLVRASAGEEGRRDFRGAEVSSPRGRR